MKKILVVCLLSTLGFSSEFVTKMGDGDNRSWIIKQICIDNLVWYVPLINGKWSPQINMYPKMEYINSATINYPTKIQQVRCK